MKLLKPLRQENYVSPEEALRELKKYEISESRPPKKPEETLTSQDTIVNDIENLGDYLQVSGITGINGNPVLMSRFEVQGMNNKNYENTHRAVFELGKGLYIPTPAIFMNHFKNVVDTYNNRQAIFDGEGNEITRDEHEEIYKHLTTNYKDIYGHDNPGSWTWLNARFVSGNGFKDLDLETIVGINSDGFFKTKIEPLEPCLDETAYAEIDFNKQGLAITKSGEKGYNQGKNLRFYSPMENTVAWFGAGSGRAFLGCDGYPRISSDSLGVFVCAEGTRAEK